MGIQIGTNFQMGNSTQIGTYNTIFSPNSISGLVAWFDMQDSTSYTNTSGAVSAIINKASQVTWSQGVSGDRPAVSTLNGFTAMSFVTNDYIISTEAAVYGALTNSAAYTFFAVIQATTADVSQGFFVVANSGQAVNSSRGFSLDTTGAGRWAIYCWNDSGTTSHLISSGSDNTNANVYESWSTGTNGSISINGAAADPSAGSQNPGTLTPNRTAIGCFPRSSLGNFFTGKIGEILLYNSNLSVSDRSNIRNYLGTKWGITVS